MTTEADSDPAVTDFSERAALRRRMRRVHAAFNTLGRQLVLGTETYTSAAAGIHKLAWAGIGLTDDAAAALERGAAMKLVSDAVSTAHDILKFAAESGLLPQPPADDTQPQ